MSSTGSRKSLHLLLVAYYFPPTGGAGVQRVLKFVKYLARDDVKITVVCAEDPHYVRDESLLHELPTEIEVIRLSHTTLLSRLLAWRNKLRKRLSGRTEGRSSGAATSSAGTLDRVKRYLLQFREWLLFPDDKAMWARKAWREVRQRISSGSDWDVVMTTSPPVSCHLVGMKVKEQLGIPWLADFRDLWCGNPERDQQGVRYALDRRFEQRWIDNADEIVTVGWRMSDYFSSICGKDADHVHVIPNGYDEDDFDFTRQKSSDAERKHLVHVGTLYGKRTPLPFLEAWATHQQQPGAPIIDVTFVGNIGAHYREVIEHYAAKFPGRINCLAYLPHREAVQLMFDADILLLLIGGRDKALGDLTGKLFEYLRTGLPILLVGPPEGDAAAVLNELQRGVAAAETDIAGITKALVSLTEQEYNANLQAVEYYSREAQARELLKILRKLAGMTGENSMTQVTEGGGL